MVNRKRILWLCVVLAGSLSIGVAVAAAKTTMRLALTPGTVHPGEAVTLRLNSSQRRCQLQLLDRGRVIFQTRIRRGRTVIPFSANSAAARLIVRVRCGRHTISKRLSVVLRPAGAPAPAPAPVTPPTAPVTPPVTTPAPTPAPPHIPPPVTEPPPPASPTGGASGGSPATRATTPTAAETAAVTTASKSIGSRNWSSSQDPSGLSLAFSYLAYYQGASLDLRQRTTSVQYTVQTTAQDVWGHTSQGTTGTGTPPYGALVFFVAKTGQSAQQASLMALMGAGGELIAIGDSSSSAVHTETLSQAEAVNSHSTYAGWWLPDGATATPVTHTVTPTPTPGPTQTQTQTQTPVYHTGPPVPDTTSHWSRWHRRMAR